jgi:AraC-like DNA-binding protein
MRSRNALTFRIHYVGVPRHSDRHQMEFLITALVSIYRRLTNTHLRPIRVRLAHPRSAASAALEDFLGQSVEFGAGHDEMTYVGAAADLPVVSADPYLNEALVRYWEDALKRRGSAQPRFARPSRTPSCRSSRTARSGLAGSRRRCISARAPWRAGLPSRTSPSRRCSTNCARTSRSAISTTPALSVSHIAWLLGFQEASAFTHAFKRWTGEAPTHRRRAERTSPGTPSGSVAPGAVRTG